MAKKKVKRPAKRPVRATTPAGPPPKKRVVVTGATGFIGSHLCRQLADHGYHVIILTLGESKQTGHDNETTVHWDGQNSETLLPYLNGAHGVVNLAGENLYGRWTSAKKRAILESRTQSGKALIRAMQSVETKPTVLIQASAVGYYGSAPDERDETSPPGQGFLAEVCREWEKSTDVAALIGVRHVIVRFGLVLGNSGGFFPKFVKPFRYCVGGPIGSGNQHVSFIHIMDAIRSLEFLLQSKDEGVFNLTAPHPCTNRELSSAISRTIHRPMLFGASAFTMQILYGQMAKETILASHRVLPNRLANAGFHFLFPTVEQAVADLLK